MAALPLIAKLFIQSVAHGEPQAKLRSILEMAPKSDVINWTDENGLDLLHYCILKSNAEATDFLLKQGYFNPPHEPSISPYLHLAALLGRKLILNVLIQHRPNDFMVSVRPMFVPSDAASSSTPSMLRTESWSKGIRPDSTFKGSKSASSSENSQDSQVLKKYKKASRLTMSDYVFDGSTPLLKTPLEVAAQAGKTCCVEVLLNLSVLKAHPNAPHKGYLTLASLANSSDSLKLLLKPQRIRIQDEAQLAKDFKNAVEICVKGAQPECLDVLLSLAPHNMNTKVIFMGINFFHVLYTFSASQGLRAYSRLQRTTRVLIQRGHDVNAKLPSRTYPLYTLLAHAFCLHDYSFVQYYLQCLQLLLQEGADPNFDEVEFERKILLQKGIKFAAGRNAYSSAFSAMLENVETYATQMSSKGLAVRVILECAEILVQYGANVNKTGGRNNLEGNLLHLYAKICVKLGVDQAIVASFFRFGAQPDAKIQGKYPINVYFDELFEQLTSFQLVDTHHKNQDDVHNMLTLLCSNMTVKQAKEAASILKTSHGRATSEQVKYYVRVALHYFQIHCMRVRSLISLTAWKVWILCGRKSQNVRALPISVELKTLILNFMYSPH